MQGHVMRAARRTGLIAAALGLAVPTATASAEAAPRQAAPAVAEAVVVHSRSATLTLNGPLTGGPETIDVTGRISVAVVTRTDTGGGGVARIVSRLQNTTGVGRTTGRTYQFVGADENTVF
ncbi:hypothetical protein SAMN05428944_3620 [Streptomyces sp. 1222.5]|nr:MULTISPECIES: hypothetical protein [unclassified Streptomyces]PKW09226.1 hypothetical protein BX260_4473 [Streptomyces sp. 5112.2]SEC41169.1 hypothetical protein SAMN05428944_3620 [Streptomyces sp. 1222.5]